MDYEAFVRRRYPDAYAAQLPAGFEFGRIGQTHPESRVIYVERAIGASVVAEAASEVLAWQSAAARVISEESQTDR